MFTDLVVTDDLAVARVVEATLRLEGAERRIYRVPHGPLAVEVARETGPDLVVLDLDPWTPDVVDELVTLRRRVTGPIVVCAPDAASEAWGQALEAGASEYVVKPIRPIELAARVAAVLRPPAGGSGAKEKIRPVQDDFLRLDFAAAIAHVQGQGIRLSGPEWRLLRLLVANRGQAVPSRTLLEAMGWGDLEMTIYLRIYLRRLREKIEQDPDRPRYLVTEPGLGYRFIRPGE